MATAAGSTIVDVHTRDKEHEYLLAGDGNDYVVYMGGEWQCFCCNTFFCLAFLRLC